jgi:predicted P-loop ATPase
MATTVLRKDDPHLLTLTQLNFKKIPNSLKQHPFWILWQPRHQHNSTKILKTPFGGKAWQKQIQSWDDIVPHYGKQQKNIPTGLGFVFTKDHPFVCIDIDDVTPTNSRMQKELDSYTERSPSLLGTHVWVQLFSIKDKAKLESYFGTKRFNKTHKRDLFISSGYCTITGGHVKTTPTDVRIYSFEDLVDILGQYFNQKIVSLEEHRQEAVQTSKVLFPRTKRQAPISAEQARLLLRKIDVRTLTSDIFDNLTHPTRLAILNPDETEEAREPWMTICQAIHHNFGGEPDGLLLLHEWSKKGNKYDKEALMSVYESFSTAPEFLNQQKPITIGTLIALVKAQRPDFNDLSPKGKPVSTIQNLEAYFKFYKYHMAFNIVTREVDIAMPKAIVTTLADKTIRIFDIDRAYRIIASELLKLGFANKNFINLRESILDYAKVNSYNPIENYFNKIYAEYDEAQDPLEDLMNTITFDNTIRTKNAQAAVKVFFKKWLTQVVAAANTSQTHSTRIFNNLMILIGEQGVGKTKWVASLFPKEIQQFCAGSGNLQINQFRTDNVKQAIELQRTLICNINEVDLLFKEGSYSKFKQLLDETTNSMVLPYGKTAVQMTRRTVFIGSTNKRHFLVDQTGNRRITLVHVDDMNSEHTMDLGQLWAHAVHWYREEKCWWLDPKNPEDKVAIEVQNKLNMQGMYIGDDGLMEDLDHYFKLDAKSIHYKKVTFKDIRMLMPSLHGVKLNSRAFNVAKMTFHNWLNQTKFGEVMKKKSGVRAQQFYLVPPIREKKQAASFKQAALLDELESLA